MRICIFSNSHGAALKDAVTSGNAIPDLEITVFAAPSAGLNALQFDESKNCFFSADPKIAAVLRITSDGQDTVDVADYDAFLVHGLFFTVPRLDKRHSRAIREATADSVIDQFAGLRLARIIRSRVQAPVALSPDPLYADIGNKFRPPAPSLPDQPMRYDDICALMAERIADPGMLYLWQPAQTIGPHLNTLIEYTTGSKRYILDQRRPRDDVRHMNGDYGRLVLDGAKSLFESKLALSPGA